MAKVMINDTQFDMLYSWRAMKEIEKRISKIDELEERLKQDDRLECVEEMLLILINAAYIADKSEARVEREWLEDNLDPQLFHLYTVAILNTLREGMKLRKKVQGSNKPRDLILEKIEKKEEAGN